MICARSSSQAAFGATSLLYHISFCLSRGFSKVFQLFSRFFREFLYTVRRPLSRLPRAPLVQCSHIIALLPPIVKGFFSSFFTSVLSAFCHNFVGDGLCKKHISCPLLAITHGFRGMERPASRDIGSPGCGSSVITGVRAN